MLASMLVIWPDRRSAPEVRREADTIFRRLVAPWVIGVVAILIFGVLREERAPTAALWMMVISQAAMFQIARLGLVRLRIDRAGWVKLVLIVAVVGAVVLLALVTAAWLLERRVSIETALVLTIALVSACYMYTAIVPRLTALALRIASRGENEEE
jgi:hypothetical protein